MIYDCFTFFNELDLLDIRLHELSPVVDRFVLVEATRTFQNKPKPLYFAENRERFSDFADRIIHVVLDDFPSFWTRFRKPKAWDFENHQRNAIARGLTGANRDDWVIVSDIDEIPRASRISGCRDIPGPHVFEQRLCYFFINYAVAQMPPESCLLQRDGIVHWRGSVMVPMRDFSTATDIRLLRTDANTHQITEGGWHFSYIGGSKMVLSKLSSFSHAKEARAALGDLDDEEKVNELIEKGVDIFQRDMRFTTLPLDETFPAYVLANRQRFAELIR